ncbi:MAG: sulfite exporter TauE/SafE family protein [Chloroflexota bacterium]
MEFPIAGVTVSPVLLAAIGFVVGLLGGFFGVGGGFLAGPAMLFLGVPANFVVGTDLAHMTGKSIVAAKRHRALGHIDLKLGALMIAGTVVGIELGAQVIEKLESYSPIVLDRFLNIFFIVLLLVISIFMFWEGLRSTRKLSDQTLSAKQASRFEMVTHRIQTVRIPPMIRLPDSGIESISLWLILLVGFVTGILAGMLGVGGGIIRMPALIYILGVPTHVAVGTDLFEIVFSAGFGTLTHAIKGNVDVLMALVMQTGAAIGAQIGAQATRYVSGPRLRLAFAFLPMIGVLLLVYRAFSGMVI